MDRVTVEGPVERLTEGDVPAIGRLDRVPVPDVHAHADDAAQLDLAQLGNALHVREGHVVPDVGTAGSDLDEPGRVDGDRTEGKPVKVGLALFPVVRVLLEKDPLAGLVFDEAERAGADGVHAEVVVTPLLDGRWGYDVTAPVEQQEEEMRRGHLCPKPDRGVVDDLDTSHVRKLAAAA